MIAWLVDHSNAEKASEYGPTRILQTNPWHRAETQHTNSHIKSKGNNSKATSSSLKETRSETMNIFLKIFIFKTFVKVELSYVFTLNMLNTADNCMIK